MVEFRYKGEVLWQRMERAVERVNERLRKTVSVLEQAEVPYAVIGGHAVRAWVAQADIAAVRTTQDVDILVRPDDFEALRQAMEGAGFFYRQTAGLDMFVEHPEASARDAVPYPAPGIARPNEAQFVSSEGPSSFARHDLSRID